MPYELIFTSAQQGASIGKSGYCTVAQTKGMSQDITLALEQTGVYHHVAAPGSGSNPTVYSYRVLDIRGETYYVLSQIRDAGLDFTGRTNYLAHHLVFDSREIDGLPSPAVILLFWDGWINSWGNQQPGFWEPTRFTQSNLSSLPKILGIAEDWQAKTGDAANAAGLMEYPPSQPVYWSCNVGGELEMVQLFAEALQLSDPAGQSFIEAWNYTFTTFLQQGDHPEQFVWRGVVPGTPAFQTAQQRGQPLQLLAQVRVGDPGNDRSKFAQTGQPQAQAAAKPEERPAARRRSSSATAGAMSFLERALSGDSPDPLKKPRKKKRSVGSSGPVTTKSQRKRQLNDPSQKWMYIGGGVIGACVLLVMILVVGSMFSGDGEPIAGVDKNESETGQNGGNVEDPNGDGNGGGSGTDPVTNALSNGNGKGGGSGTDPVTNKPLNGNGKPAKPTKADRALYDFITKKRIYLVRTQAGEAQIAENDPRMKEDAPLGVFFKALKDHNAANFTKKKNPDPFEAATFDYGPKPMKLSGGRTIRYDSKGGTQAKPVQYDLELMRVLASKLNAASKPAGIYFNFPSQRLWIHIQGNGFEPFYMVPLEVDRYSALVTMKANNGIEFDEGAMTAKVRPQISEAVKKLLLENESSTEIILRAGPPLATWGLAHNNNTDTIDFKKAHLDQQIKLARTKVDELKNFVQWTDNALRDLFPAAQKVADVREKLELADPDLANLNRAKRSRQRAFVKADGIMKKYKCYQYFNGQTLSQLWLRGRKDNQGGMAVMQGNVLFIGATNDPNFKDPADPNLTISKSDYIMQICDEYFLAADEVVNAQQIVDGKEKKNKSMAAEVKRRQAAYGKISVLYLGKGSHVAGLDQYKQALAFDAGRVVLGSMALDEAKTKWKERKANLTAQAQKDLDRWNDKTHQKAEWGRFKKHQMFYLAEKIGTGSTIMVPLVQFTNK